MIVSSYVNTFFSYTHKIYKAILSVEKYDILMGTQNIFFFERLTQEFDTLFYYTFQEGPKTQAPQHLHNPK